MNALLKGLSASLAALAAPLAAAGAELSPALQKLIAAANAEGVLDLSWAPTGANDTRDMQAIAAAMEKEWGAKIKINFTPGPSMPSVGQQIATEFQAKQKSVTDVWHTSGSYIVPLLARDMFLSADWKALLPGRITDQVIEAEGRLVRVITGLTGALFAWRCWAALQGERLPRKWLLLLLVIAGLSSFTAPLSNPGLRTLFPLMTPRHLWEPVNAIDSNGWVIASIVGPPIAAVTTSW